MNLFVGCDTYEYQELVLRLSGLLGERASFASQHFRASWASFEHAWTWTPYPIVETERSFERVSEFDSQNFWASWASFEQNSARTQHYQKLFTLHISSYDFQVRAFLCGLVHFVVKIETELHVVLQKSRLRLLQFTSIADIFVLTKPPCNMFYGTFHIS